MIDRMIRAARLDIQLYEEVEHRGDLTSQALTVVVLVSVLSGVGLFLSQAISGQVGQAIGGLILGAIAAIVGWVVWSFLTYWIGTTFLGGTATYGELLRTIGYASSPNALRALGFIPVVGGIIVLVASLWTLVAGVVAVRQALDFSTGRAIVTVVIGWVPMVIIMVLFMARSM
ncbi:MAG: YIP1 family protein [Chloroflexi bacterium]|nr:YIP1 family protein [Chloroflexota bacterium]